MPRFGVGDRVRILDLPKEGHVRTPFYVRGQIGVVERFCGAYLNPEDLAYGRDGLPARDLYRVRLPQTALWPAYTGLASDTLDIEIYGHWLDPA